MDSSRQSALTRLLRRLPYCEELELANRRLAEERTRLLSQRDALEGERDELQDHAERLAGERDAGQHREEELRSAIAGLESQRDALAAERDEMLGHADRLNAQLDEFERRRAEDRQAFEEALEQARQRIRDVEEERQRIVAALQETNACLEREITRYQRLVGEPSAQFYSPIVDAADPHVQAVLARESGRFDARCDDVRLDRKAMLDLFHQIADQYPQLRFPVERSPGHRYHFENPFFSYGDAITLFGLLLILRPQRLFEAGAGYSSCVVMDTNDHHLDGSIDATFLDPHPDPLLDRLPPDDPYRERVVRGALQDVPAGMFTSLEANDILFLDSSHVGKMGSDVNDYLFRILPALAPGVVVHIHDIFYPFEYPASWVREHGRSWNEAYLVRAFLGQNRAFEVIFFNDLIYNAYPELTREKMPLCLGNTGGSLWLRKVQQAVAPAEIISST